MKREVRVNPGFCLNGGRQRALVQDLLSRFQICELAKSDELYAQQLLKLYSTDRSWKYEPGRIVLDALERFNYHIVLVIPKDQPDKVAGSVRAVFLPRSNLVYGSCLIINPEFRSENLSLPLIYAAMSVVDEDSKQPAKADPAKIAAHGIKISM